MRRHALKILILAASAGACRPAAEGSDLSETWYEHEAPELFRPVDPRLYKFAQMARTGSLGEKKLTEMWGGSYWPLASGGVARRWQESGTVLADGKAFDPAQAAGLDLGKLSPIEKYDLVTGAFDMTATKAELTRAKAKSWQSWEGYCHGWSTATMVEKVPTVAADVPVKGHPELKVRFEPDDVKAILTKFYGDYIALTGNGTGKRAVEIGTQCLLSSSELSGTLDPDTGEPLRDAATNRLEDLHCRDVNPATMHLLLEQMMGSEIEESSRRSFVMDTMADKQVWNHPVVGYDARQTFPAGLSTAEREALSTGLAAGKLSENAGCKKRLTMDADAGLARIRGRPGKRPACLIDLETDVYHLALSRAGETARAEPSKMTVRYTLELDDDGYVTGGEWDHKTMGLYRPDVAWIPKVDFHTMPIESQGSGPIEFHALQDLLSRVLGQSSSAH